MKFSSLVLPSLFLITTQAFPNPLHLIFSIDNDISTTVSKPSSLCWKACFSAKPTCPEGFEADGKDGGCWTCCIPEKNDALPRLPQSNEDMSVTVKIDSHSDVAVQESDICWKACFPEELQCPSNAVAKQIGGCWTCCFKPASLEIGASNMPKETSKALSSTSDICWLLCLTEKPICPSGFYEDQQGDCWTCCARDSSSATRKPLQIGPGNDDSTVTTSNADVCWMICAFAKPKCPEQWNAKQLGECWTCCRDSDNAETNQKTLGDGSLKGFEKALASQSADVCWAACFYNQPRCPNGFNSKQFGECWTCCTDSGSLESTQKTIGSSEVRAHSKALNTQSPEICWRACFSEQPKCPNEWKARELGMCWTCCQPSDDYEIKQKYLDGSAKHSDMKQFVASVPRHEM